MRSAASCAISASAGWSTTWVVSIGWLVAIVLAGLADQPVALWVRDSGLGDWVRHHWVGDVAAAPGTYYFALGVAAVLWVGHRASWRAAGLVCLTGVPDLTNCLAKWIFGRARPFKLIAAMEQPAAFEPHWFYGGLPGLLLNGHLAFPSGHTCTAFATATAVAILWPRWRWAYYGVAAVVGLERIAENAHYVSDVVAGAGLGVGGVYVVVAVLERFKRRFQNRKGGLESQAHCPGSETASESRKVAGAALAGGSEHG